MKKRIYKNMLALAFIGAFAVASLLLVAFYILFSEDMQNEVKQDAIFFARSFDYSENNLDYLRRLKLTREDDRLSIITQDGYVIFDSYHDIASMGNHLDRPEVKEALLTGYGEGKRFSATLGDETYYYAVKLSNGDVLRLAKTINNIYGFFIKAIPFIGAVTVLILLLCNFLAARLTKRIIEPINSINFGEIRMTEPFNYYSYYCQSNIKIYDELAPFIRTIASQKEQIEKHIMAFKNRTDTVKTIIEDMKEGLILLDKHGIILSSNKSAIDFFGNTGQSYQGKNILELTRNINLLDQIKVALGGKRGDITLPLGAKTVQVFFSPVYQNGKVNGTIILFLDITEKANAEKIRREFSANVSHELKTPLTTILGLSEMIDNGMAKKEDIVTFAGKIKSEVARLISLIEDIIRLSEFDEKIGEKQFEQFDLLELTNTVVNNLKQSASEKGVTIEVAGENLKITANKRMIDELLYNLIDNGIKYNKKSGKVTVSWTNEETGTKIEVSDTGIGIPEENLNRIFERFYRVDKSRSKKTGGTGLGLSIVKHIAQYHNGYAEIRSRENVGTVITVLINTR